MSRDELASTLWRFHLAGPERQCSEILAAGWRKPSLDDATVERAAVALYVHNNPVGNWGGHSARVKTPYRDAARAVLAAAVEAGQ